MVDVNIKIFNTLCVYFSLFTQVLFEIMPSLKYNSISWYDKWIKQILGCVFQCIFLLKNECAFNLIYRLVILDCIFGCLPSFPSDARSRSYSKVFRKECKNLINMAKYRCPDFVIFLRALIVFMIKKCVLSKWVCFVPKNLTHIKKKSNCDFFFKVRCQSA